MRDETVAGFLNDLGSKQPVPGGGAVAAVNGAIAAAQLKMVCGYTHDNVVSSKVESLSLKINTFLDLADADVKAFANVTEAYRSKNEQQINKALINAMSPSISVADNCEELTGFCEENLEKFNPKLKADLIVVLANLKASLRSAKAMIGTNMEALGRDLPQDSIACVQKCNALIGKIDGLFERLGA